MKIKKQDIQLALYGEIVDEIARVPEGGLDPGDYDLIDQKTKVGMGEVYGYLHRYDTDTIFNNDSWEDVFLKQLCVNVIAWHLITLATPGVRMDLIRQNYEDAVAYLVQVQKGHVRPNWPLRPDDPATPMDEAGNIQWKSNPKRGNHY